MATGFYRVLKIKQNGKEYYKYKINNKLIKKEFVRSDILDLRRAVQNAGFLWGITDLEEAKKNTNGYSIGLLQGRYGIQI